MSSLRKRAGVIEGMPMCYEILGGLPLKQNGPRRGPPQKFGIVAKQEKSPGTTLPDQVAATRGKQIQYSEDERGHFKVDGGPGPLLGEKKRN